MSSSNSKITTPEPREKRTRAEMELEGRDQPHTAAWGQESSAGKFAADWWGGTVLQSTAQLQESCVSCPSSVPGIAVGCKTMVASLFGVSE